jgi:uncharacterized protein (TIGR00159 family)
MILAFKIGFLPIRIWDLLDVLIVGYLLYQIYRLLRGNIAMNIFLGVVLLYVFYWVVEQLEMELLSWVLEKFVSVGVIIIVIIFQQEIRNFLLFLGKTTLKQRSNVIARFLDFTSQDDKLKEKESHDLSRVILRLSKSKTGALILLARDENLDGVVLQGTELNAQLSETLVETIFHKNSPLHDGAMLLRHGIISKAGCVLPLSERTDLPKQFGLRHRAAIGFSEKVDAGAIVVSEESGRVTWVKDGRFQAVKEESELTKILLGHL